VALGVVATLIVLAGAAQVASAVKSPPPPADPANPYANDTVVPREIKRQLRAQEERDARRKTDEAKVERKASRIRYRDKSDREALALARAKFELLLTAPGWTGLSLRRGERVKQYVDDFQALVQVGDDPEDVALVESELPLRNEQAEPVDLDLEPRGDGFVPTASGVELDIPGDLAEGVAMARGQLRIKPATDAATEPTLSDNKVFYGNAQTDTDVVVAPTARGFETFTQLRSADSPERLTFDVEVPGGATLRQEQPPGREQGEAPIEVVSPGGKRIATISPPRALAADGEPVAVDYTIEGMRVTMKVAHRELDVAYPILVDPDAIYEDWRNWSWAAGNRDNHRWQYGSWGHPECGWRAGFGQGAWTYGQIVYHPDGNYCELDNWAEAKFQAPQMSYIYRAEYVHMNHQNRFTCAVAAIWGPWSGNWDGNPWVYCGDLWNHSHGHCPAANCDPNAGQPSNVAVFKVQISGGAGRRVPGARAELGGSLLWLRDREHPVIDDTGQRTDGRWYRSGRVDIAPRAHDDGLGMNKFQLTIPGFVDDYRRHPCVRTRCPGPWSLPNDGQGIFSYNVADIPNGINTVTLNARDVLDKITGRSWTLNVDDELPNLHVYGPLRQAENIGEWWGSKTLSIQSSDGVNDGNPANQRSGVKTVDIYVDGTVRHSQTQNCYASCRLDLNWNFDTRAYAPGTHDIRVVARDGAGNERSSSTWSVMTAHSDPGGSTDKVETPDADGDAPDGGAGIDPNMCVDPSMYCGENDANNPAEIAADAEPPLAGTNDPITGLPKISIGSAYWGWADQDYKNFDLRLTKELYKDEPKKFARVIIPWDMLLLKDGVPNTVPGFETDGRMEYKWLVRDPNDETKAIEKSVRYSDPGVFKKYERWMERAKANGWKVMVSFGSTEVTLGNFEGQPDYKLGARVLPWPSFGDSSPYQPISYIYNVTKILEYLRSTYPELSIDYMSAWNEPNHPSYSTGGRYSFPHLKTLQQEKDDKSLTTDAQMANGAWYAGRYYNYLRKYCSTHGCGVLAGEMVDRNDMDRYFGHYKANINGRPKRWAYHPYLAGRIGASSLTADKDNDGIPNFKERFEFYMRNTGDRGSSTNGADVWFTEVGPLYSGTNGNPDWSVGVEQLEAQIDLTRHRRVKRFYYYSTRGGYEIKNGKNVRHDSGFIDPAKEGLTGTAPNFTPFVPNRAEHIRPAYCTYGEMVRGVFVFGRIEGALTPRVYADDNDDDDPSTKDFWVDGVRGCS
jgi:hypothetical protein